MTIYRIFYARGGYENRVWCATFYTRHYGEALCQLCDIIRMGYPAVLVTF